MSLLQLFIGGTVNVPLTTHTFKGSDYQLARSQVPFPNLYAPSCHYKNGRTYLGTSKSWDENDGNHRLGIIEYYQGNFSIEFVDSDPLGPLDYHDNPIIRVEDDGTIWLFHEMHWAGLSNGSVGYVEVWKTSIPYDITSFVKQPDSAYIGCYPKVYNITDTTYVFIGRYNPLHWSDSGGKPPVGAGELYTTIFDGTTWGTPVQMTYPEIEQDSGEGWQDERHYPNYIVNAEQDGWVYLAFTKRIGSTNAGNATYSKTYHVKFEKSNVYTWHNLGGTFSKDVQSNGFITEAELDANCLTATNTDTNYNNKVRGFGIVDEGKIYHHHLINGVNKLSVFDGAWTSQVSDLKVDELDPTNDQTMLMFDNGKHWAISVKNENELHLMETTDLSTWQSKQVLFVEDIVGLAYPILPHNYQDIPNGQKYCIFVGEKNYESYASIHCIEMIK